MNGSAVSSLTNARGMADPMETSRSRMRGGQWSELGSEAGSGLRSSRRYGNRFGSELGESDLRSSNAYEHSRHSSRSSAADYHEEAVPEYQPSAEELERAERAQAIAALEDELKGFTSHEERMEPVLQLYEEVIELRREAEALKEDEDRAVRQLATGDVSSLYDGDVERVVGELEAAVENSYLQACWTKERQRYTAKNGTDLPEWWRVNLADLMPRLQDAKRLFERSNGTARDLYRSHEAKVNANTDARDKVKAEMLVEIAGELDQLKQQRERLLVIDKEQRFHLRRGTHVKELQLTAKKQKDALESRAGHEETRQFGAGVRLNDVIHDLKMQIIQLQRELRDVKVSGETTLRLLQSQMQDVTKSGEEVRKARAEYEEENESLMSLKHELQCVLHYVRVRAREANY